MPIGEKYKQLCREVSSCAGECGRNPNDILLLAVSKTVGLDGVLAAIDAGCVNFGENRPDELIRKHDAFPDVNWHFIGNIQSRRIKDIVPRAHLIHSVCQLEHARKINEVADSIGKLQHILLEVNVSGESSKSGFAPNEVEDIFVACMNMSSICACGLMTMAPIAQDDVVKECFMGLSELLVNCNALADKFDYPRMSTLSMGMSGDWRCAIECGSTIVRIGSAIFA